MKKNNKYKHDTLNTLSSISEGRQIKLHRRLPKPASRESSREYKSYVKQAANYARSKGIKTYSILKEKNYYKMRAAFARGNRTYDESFQVKRQVLSSADLLDDIRVDTLLEQAEVYNVIEILNTPKDLIAADFNTYAKIFYDHIKLDPSIDKGALMSYVYGS